jgi:hypothetical protein
MISVQVRPWRPTLLAVQKQRIASLGYRQHFDLEQTWVAD